MSEEAREKGRKFILVNLDHFLYLFHAYDYLPRY